MKRYQRVLVYVSFLIGLPTAICVIPHQMPDRLFMVIWAGVIALIYLAVFYYRRYGDPDYDSSIDDLDRYGLEVVALWAFVVLAAFMMSFWLAR